MTRPHYEAWTLPTDATFQKIIDVPALAGSSGSRELSNYSDNTAMVRANWAGRDQVGKALLRRYMGTKVTDEWIIRRIDKSIERPGSYELSGPQINGITEGLSIFPFRYPNDKPEFQDWIWGGDNAVGDLSLSALGNIEETYELYLSGERYVLDKNSATAGTFTLTVDSQTTAAIAWDASSADIQSALEALSSVTEVTVRWDPDDSDHQIVFDDPKNLTTDMTADFSGLTGSATLTKGNDGFDPSLNPTFTLTVDGDTTEALAWDAATNTIEGSATGGTGLQGLSTVNDVRVTGSGIFSDPWIIVFVSPPSPGNLTVTFAAGSAIRRRTEAGALDPSPITISKPVDQGAGSEEEHGSYEEPPIQIITDAAHQDGDTEWVLRVNALSRYGGSQLTPTVTAGGLYQGKIRVKPTVSGTYTLVFRRMDGGFIKNTSPRDVQLTAGSYGDLIVSDLQIPDDVDQIIMRVAVTDANPDNIGPFYVNWEDAELIEGQPPTTFTEIVRTLVEHGQERSSFEFLDPDFTDAADTAGNVLEDESFTAFAFSNLSHVLADGHDMGYKWRVVAKATPSGGKTHNLQIYYEGEAEDLTASSGGPTVQAGAVRDASVVSRTPEFTVAVGWGSEGLYVEVEDAALVSTYGRIEKVFDAEHLTSEDSLTRLLEEKFREQTTNADALTATVNDDVQQVPLVDYAEGSKIWWAFPDQDVSKVAKVVERVSWVEGLSSSTYTLNGSEELSEYGAMARAVDHLLRQFKVRRRNRPRAGGQGRDRTLGQVTGAHIHLQRTSNLSLTSDSRTAIPWTFFYETVGRENFAAPSFPATAITIQEPGYYDFEIAAGLESAVSSIITEVVRVRGGVETVVWPPPSDPGLWDASFSTRRGRGVAKGIPCLSGDEIKIYVTQSSGSAVNLTSATFVAELVDRVVRSEWERIFTADNWGVTWDPVRGSWWTTDPADDVAPALFERDLDGSILNSYSGYDNNPTAERNRGIVYADGFLWGLGNSEVVSKIDPSDGSVVSTFSTDGGSDESATGIGWDGSHLYVVEVLTSSEVRKFATSGGTRVDDFAFPSGHTLFGLTWDGANWWATTENSQTIVRMDSSFNVTLSIPGPPATGRGCHFRDGYLYVMTDEGLFRKAV